MFLFSFLSAPFEAAIASDDLQELVLIDQRELIQVQSRRQACLHLVVSITNNGNEEVHHDNEQQERGQDEKGPCEIFIFLSKVEIELFKRE